jgi:chaperonin GroEL
LSGKVAVIKVGGATETEIEEKKFRVDDAVHSVKAALSEGIVPGGGVTMLNISMGMILPTGGKAKTAHPLTGKETEFTLGISSTDAGGHILRNALQKPFRILLRNSGLNPDEWLPKVVAKGQGFGVNVSDPGDDVIEMKEKGIVDPTRVIKEAIQNAVSIAGTAMTMGALVTDVPEKAPAMPPGGGMDMGMGM